MKQISLFLIIWTIFAQNYLHAGIKVTVNSAKWVEFPLVKKIGVYQTPLVSREWITRDVPKLNELEVRSMRYEMACGKDDLYGQPCVYGSADKLTFAYTDIDYFLTLTKKYAPVLVISQGYTPTILQSRPTEWSGFMDMPTDLDTWGKINGHFASHWKSKGYHNSYVEIWNEPDLTNGFFTGTLEDYLRIYEYAATPVNTNNGDIKVGGPSGAFNGWHQPLADYAKAKGLPLDFLSGHAYGPDYSWQLTSMRAALNSFGNNQAEMLLTEYAPYVPADYQADGPVEKAESAMTFFNALPGMLECPDLTYVNWAQYIDPGFFVGDKLGMIDRDSGSRKALFNAFRLYGLMPDDRRQLTVSGGNLSGLASGNDNCIAAVVWNTETTEKDVDLTLINIPFENGKLEAYHIDETHNSWYETRRGSFTPSRSEEVTISNHRLTVSDVVRSKGVFFVRILSDDADPLFPTVKLGTIMRTRYWFPKRTSEASYAIFDPKTWTVRMSSNKESTGRALIGIEVEKMPDYLHVQGERNGLVRTSTANSGLSIQVDFQDKAGEHVHSVLFCSDSYSASRTRRLPWGKAGEADEIVQVEDLNDFTIDLASHRPESFSGRVIITCDMEAVGANVKQNFQFSKGEPTEISSIHNEASIIHRTSAVYDLSGRRFNTSSPLFNKGGGGAIFICGKKKYMIK